ncbi:DegT/DnrJ/EryC1/StrS family aminotransferase [Methanococcus maripaludis]|uniref:dTDP-4-amino-4,6-dideoxygalactose transaminase n=1 Tax=Methanococcus maripaludis TaxID=39152 RepID=A0A7J9PSS4_METMI|nr:DegT/DnrJ/EryC1/StrS family aminotransferase [Methanococcus maripaludis]MBA2869072.1 dTDP-4-amino-4,6-dideoxygalactose transaminase [Methanococcus maripaludis]
MDIIYKKLYREKGSLNVSVSPLVCFDALYPIIKNNHNINFVDINPKTLNMDEKQISEDTQIIQPIHFGGNPQNMDKISEISKNGQIILEDCAQGYGSIYNNKFVGNFGDYSVFSLMKNIYGLGGGVIISKEDLNMPQNKELGYIPTTYRKIKRLLESKSTYNSILTTKILYGLLSLRPTDQTKFYKEYTVNNTIINSIYSQIINFDILINKRMANADYILNRVNKDYLEPQNTLSNAVSNYTRLYFVLTEKNSKETIKSLRDCGIGANHITQDSVKYFQDSVFKNNFFSNYADKKNLKEYSDVHDRLISLPISPNLSKKEMDYILKVLNQVCRC